MQKHLRPEVRASLVSSTEAKVVSRKKVIVKDGTIEKTTTKVSEAKLLN